MKVLTIEDQPVAAMLLNSTLRSLGHDVDYVTNPAEVLARTAQGAYRVVVSDWRMPGMDGLTLCRKIREQGGPYVYFILVSVNRITKENRQLALAAGVDDFLNKPIDMDEIGMRLHVAERILRLAERTRSGGTGLRPRGRSSSVPATAAPPKTHWSRWLTVFAAGTAILLMLAAWLSPGAPH
jgi:CheY-like chemotaxis protein